MEYRIYRRASSGGYDGATAESGTYTSARYLYTTDATGVVGLFSAANLGRRDVASRVRVVADRVAPGDTYAVVNAVAGTVRKSATLLTADSDWLLLYPDDEERTYDLVGVDGKLAPRGAVVAQRPSARP